MRARRQPGQNSSGVSSRSTSWMFTAISRPPSVAIIRNFVYMRPMVAGACASSAMRTRSVFQERMKG